MSTHLGHTTFWGLLLFLGVKHTMWNKVLATYPTELHSARKVDGYFTKAALYTMLYNKFGSDRNQNK